MIKSFYTALWVCLLVAGMVGCTDHEQAVPVCVQVEVIGEGCVDGWYVLRIMGEDDVNEKRTNQYIGQLQRGTVTTDNLPAELHEPGTIAYLSLERNSAYGPVCQAIYTIYPPVRVKQVCRF